MFKEYKSKPITRKAHQLTIKDIAAAKVIDNTTIQITIGNLDIRFKHYEPVHVGDFIVYLDETDIYHCSEKVFRERNIA